MSDNLYAKREPWNLEPYYSQHVSAMTTEDLHAKAEIAAELAFRDKRIAELEADNARMRTAAAKLRYIVHSDDLSGLASVDSDLYDLGVLDEYERIVARKVMSDDFADAAMAAIHIRAALVRLREG